MQDWLWMTAADLGRGIAAGDIDPAALAETYLAAIAAHPHRDRIYTVVTQTRARTEAKAAAARARSGLRRSALDGVPISWKDLFDSAGTETEAGTNLLKGRIPDQDAKVLENAAAAGLVCLGKTHLSEIAFSGLGLNPVMETPPNVNDPGAVPGGSSSGAAASVAFGLAAAGIGSDTGGSVRVPAAWNDLVGLKTTHGRLSVDGAVALCRSFDTVGPITRTVEDAALLLAVMEDSKPVDLGGATLHGVRLLILDTIATTDLRDEPAAAFEQSVTKLQSAGATVARATFPNLTQAFDDAAALYGAESYAQWRSLVEANPKAMFPQILERVRGGRNVLAADYIAAWHRLTDIRAAYTQLTAGYDAVIMPTAPIMPPNMQQLLDDDAYYKTENLLALRNTRIGNLMGLCGLTLPTGTPSCGLLLNGAPGSEARLLRLGVAVAAAL